MNNTISSIVARGAAFGLLVAFGLFTPACGTDTAANAGGGGGGGGGDIAMTAIQATLVSAMCDMNERCGGAGILPFSFSSAAACKTTMGASGTFEIDELEAVAAGNMVYSGSKASECVALMKGATCGGLDMEGDNACSQVFTGAVDDGAACAKSDVCKSGWCTDTDEPAVGCPGKCAPQKKVGEACDSADADECAGTAVCVNQKCAAASLGKVGEACDYRSCEKGLRCDNSGASETCVKRGALGEACKNGAECASGLRCLSDKCAVSGKADEKCNFQASFQGAAECVAGLTCAIIFENGAPGAQTCKTKVALGGACTAVNECAGIDLYCTAGKCASLPKIGEACAQKAESPMFQCAIGTECKAGTCAQESDAKEGESCESDPCADGLSCSDKSVCDKAKAPVCTKK